MKKIIYSLLVLAMTAFTFSSCEDVPAPYPIPEESGNNGGSTGTETDGSESNPYTVTDAIKVASGTSKFVKGYIVGFIPKSDASTYIENTIFAATGDGIQATNFVIAETPDETDYKKCMAVALTAGDIRTALNLVDNPGNYKKEVLLCGNIEKYFGAMGVKSVVWAKIDNTEVGTKPGSPEAPVAGEAKGTGTEADPFNSVAAYQKAKELASGAVSTESYYIKGKVRTITEQYGAQYGNTTVEIADDESSQIFTIYRALYFGNKKWAEGDKTLNVGDEVVFYGPIMNYNGTTPETESGKAYLISLNGEKGSGTVTPDPTPDPTPSDDGMTSTIITNNKVGDVSLLSNGYGSQDVTKEDTWYSWQYNGVTYKAARVMISAGTNGKGIQMQGDASAAAKQGFLFNSTEFSKEIQTVTVYLSTKEGYYAPTYSFYAAKAANGKDNSVVATQTSSTTDGFTTYKDVYDLSSFNTKFFSLYNNTKGALYIEKIEVTLK